MLLTNSILKSLQDFYRKTGHQACKVYLGSRAFRVLSCEMEEELGQLRGFVEIKLNGVSIQKHPILLQDQIILVNTDEYGINHY